MKILHAFFFCCTAGLVAINATQAAELHNKAKPLSHAKSCSAYGAGFRRVPGSELCMKIGGWVRAQSTAGSNGSVNWRASNAPATGTTATSARGYITTDVREPTGYGTVRAYVSVGVNHQ